MNTEVKPVYNGIQVTHNGYIAWYRVRSNNCELDILLDSFDSEITSDMPEFKAFKKPESKLFKELGHLYCKVHSRLLTRTFDFDDGVCDLCETE